MLLVLVAEQQASEDAVLVVGAGIAGLATAAALHKVLPILHPDLMPNEGTNLCCQTESHSDILKRFHISG